MNQIRASIFTFMLCGSVCLFGQGQPAESNHQDVPTQQAPGTNNPDVGKQRRPAPATPQGGGANTESADLPTQQPGTNNPDVAKQRRDANATGGTDTAGGQQSGGKKKSKRKSTRTDS